MKLRAAIILFVYFALALSLSHGQATSGYHRVSQVLARGTGVSAQIVPYATIAVTSTATGLAGVIYADPALTVRVPNSVVTSDANGNFGYYFNLNLCMTEKITFPNGGGFTQANICSNGGSGGCPTSPCQISGGGTGASSAPTALANLGAVPIAGGTMTGPLETPKLNNVPIVSVQAGTDFGVQVAEAQALLGTNGGVLDATGSILSSGTTTCTTAITLAAGQNLRLGAGANISGSCPITMSVASRLECAAGPGTGYNEGIPENCNWQFTGSGNFISVPGNQWDVSISHITFKGPFWANNNTGSGTGHGLYVTGTSFGVTGLTLDHTSFIGFWQDGVHLEDNVYLVKCEGCVSLQNGRYGWYQAPNVGTQAPNQIQLIAPYFESNAGGNLYAAGGVGAGEIAITGGTISSDLSPAIGTTSYCAQFVASSGQQINAWISKVHFENCGKSVGGGAFIEWNVANGYSHFEDNMFVNQSGYTAYALQLDANFGDGSLVFMGPGNYYSTPSQTYRINNVNPATTGYLDNLDYTGPPAVNGLPGSAALNGFNYPNILVCGQIYGHDACNFGTGVQLYFNDSVASENFYFADVSGSLTLFDQAGNPIVGFGPTSRDGNRTTFSQGVQFNQYYLMIPQTYSALTGCSGGIDGEVAQVTDSTTNTWGATISGGGSDVVLAFCDGSAWTVFAK